MSLPPPVTFMFRCVDAAFAPRSSVMLGAEPLVHATVTEPLPLSADAALATAEVLIVQFAVTEALTARLAGVLPAYAALDATTAPTLNTEASASVVARLLSRIEFIFESFPIVMVGKATAVSPLVAWRENSAYR